MGERVECLVGDCRRTRAADRYDEWICAVHWKLVPSDIRKAHVKAKADVRKIAGWPSGGANATALEMARDRAVLAWEACRSSMRHVESEPEGLSRFLAEWA